VRETLVGATVTEVEFRTEGTVIYAEKDGRRVGVLVSNLGRASRWT
jgi:hypothetical protein